MIQKHEAQLATLSIDIQAIRVNGKRMSLAAFKQLQEGDYLDENKPNCRRWGIVRYKLDKDDYHCLWVVYSQDGTLYRRKTPIDHWQGWQFFKTEDGNYRVDGEDIPNYRDNGYFERRHRSSNCPSKEEEEQRIIHDNKLFLAGKKVEKEDCKMCSELPHLFIAV